MVCWHLWEQKNDNLARSAKLSYELRATSNELLRCTRG